ncbi:response regulator transcription factor [Adhaeribacter swui]|uniref:Response regulator transcription factor n=1 Tax=Adhaeribacter swui TaxID=2086471 RepID=A0A7G7G4Z1_9BACT|nr:response regulator transcription factor [Adhaeribacter swui]QNF32225.1 response regulator transcription factor [Adhaeribacter swui]
MLVTESNLLTRRGIATLLAAQHGVEVIGEAENISELTSWIKNLQPQVVTVDGNFLQEFGAPEMETLQQLAPQTYLLAITTNSEKYMVVNALKVGVTSYILKDCDEQELLQAVRTTAQGKRFICSKVLEVILADTGSVETVPDNLNLSSREIEVIRLIAEGKSTAEIAETLFLSPHTINSHRKNILRKLQIKSPVELIIKAMDLGIVKIS